MIEETALQRLQASIALSAPRAALVVYRATAQLGGVYHVSRGCKRLGNSVRSCQLEPLSLARSLCHRCAAAAEQPLRGPTFWALVRGLTDELRTFANRFRSRNATAAQLLLEVRRMARRAEIAATLLDLAPDPEGAVVLAVVRSLIAAAQESCQAMSDPIRRPLGPSLAATWMAVGIYDDDSLPPEAADARYLVEPAVRQLHRRWAAYAGKGDLVAASSALDDEADRLLSSTPLLELLPERTCLQQSDYPSFPEYVSAVWRQAATAEIAELRATWTRRYHEFLALEGEAVVIGQPPPGKPIGLVRELLELHRPRRLTKTLAAWTMPASAGRWLAALSSTGRAHGFAVVGEAHEENVGVLAETAAKLHDPEQDGPLSRLQETVAVAKALLQN